ncbi:SWIM zinc finger family protein, partial [Streptomyces noursei]|uniref:SWIM zinc finger family protein n=1 Tax=Streptomyces noursei TaxID=1971 RepID=UPI003B968538
MCEGGDGTRYGTVVDLDGPAFQCSCPSRKFPCKHTLGLLLRWAGDEAGEPARPGGGPAGGGDRDLAGEYGDGCRVEGQRNGLGRRDGVP